LPGSDVKAQLIGSFHAAIAAADPRRLIGADLELPTARRMVVVGGGKAAASMARALEDAFPDRHFEGVVTTRYQHGLATRSIRVVEAGHPVPDDAGDQAARDMLALAASLDREDLLLVLVSGGASSLMSCPIEPLLMSDLSALNRELLRSGAPITEMNIVRKHVSAISGGRLAAATRAQVVCLIISDVTGDDPSAIGSGPCAPDPSTYADALAIAKRYRMDLPERIATHLQQGAAGQRAETPKPADPLFARVENRIIAAPHQSLEAAQLYFRELGINAVLLGDTVTGEARDAAQVYAALVREIRRYDAPFAAPVALISGGECTVTIEPGNQTARGGRCSEFLLALALELGGLPEVYAMAGDTDGIDGSEDNAGAVIAPDTLARAAASGLSAKTVLHDHDAWGFFDRLGDLVVTGPTRTNVNDYRVILIK
jgi:hydroxypyruvate reductase